jgi:CHAT domain-containing protein/lipoprotein NlpI
MRGWASAIAVGLLVLSVGEVGAIAGTEPLIAQRDETTDARDRHRALELSQQAEQLYQVGRLQEALTLWEEALVIFRAIGDRKVEGTMRNNIGAVYYHQGQHRLALEQYQHALAIRRAVGDHVGEITTLNNIGTVYDRQGQYGLMLEHYQQALTIAREVGDRAGEGTTLNNIGVVYRRQGQYGLALEQYQQALAIRRAVGDRAGEGTTLNNIGLVYRRQGQYRLALEQYQQALTIARAVGDRADEGTTLNNIGLVYHSQGQSDLALDQFQQSLVIRRAVGDRANEGATLNNIGLVYHSQGRYGLVLEQFQQALAILREVGDRAGEGLMLNNIGYFYRDLNDLDRAASFFQQSLTVTDAIEREIGQQDHSRIAFFETRSFTYTRLTQVLASQQKNDRALEIADRARARSLTEFLNPSTAENPRSDLTFEDMQRMARDRDATILVYAIIEKEIYIWAVTPAGEIAFEKVDPEALGIPITAVADRARQAANFPSNNFAFSQEKYRLDLQATRSSGVGEDGLFAEDPEHLKRIYRLLIQPIEAHLPNDSGARLLIVPHRELGTVPFAALLDERDRFLVDRYAISVTPSLQVLDTVSRQRPAVIGPALVVGNPSPMPNLLDPLPASETEATAIAALLNTTPLLNRQATETAVKQQLATARILHLATHGVLETDDRGVENAWLAFGPDGQNDGKLDLSEVFDSNLSAELAVLSACDTNRGDTAGEGVIGLGRAFLKAGTPTVVASLWKVPDQQTASLMEAFYEELLAGRDRADALRLAQLKVREQYPNPRYWAAFVLIGEGDRPLDPS